MAAGRTERDENATKTQKSSVDTAEAKYRLKSPQIRERDVLAACRSYLRVKGWFCCRIHQGLGCMPGIPDLVAMRDGITIWIEVKAPRCHQSAVQVQWQQYAEQAGALYVVVRDVQELVDMIAEDAQHRLTRIVYTVPDRTSSPAIHIRPSRGGRLQLQEVSVEQASS